MDVRLDDTGELAAMPNGKQNFWKQIEARGNGADYYYNFRVNAGERTGSVEREPMCSRGLRMLHDMSESSCEGFGLDVLIEGTLTRRSLGLPSRRSGAYVFACFSKHVKIRRELFDVWMRALARLPHAYLWLLQYPAETEASIRNHIIEKFGKDVNRRVVFSEFLASSDRNFARLAAGAT